ncbi:MAG TPA: Gfo/Idh/MocA family oxidoreductase [Longimicrobiales bacterium]|nr:Gfo/Idh/MocA family oxidoreductase [Longimicrobiales bacterium]
MKPVRLLVWGCGRIAQMFHLRHLASHGGATVVGVADADPTNLARAAALLPGAATFHDYRESLRVAADGVVICLPPALHAPAAVDAFQAGFHVYLEKPLATDLAHGEEVVGAWRCSGRLGVMGFNFRFHPRFAEARARLREIGPLRGVQTVFTSQARTLPVWKRTREGGGGVLLDLASHHVDLMRFLFRAEVERVVAFQRTQEAEGDNAVLGLELDNGLLAQTWVSMNSVQTHRWEIFGRNGSMLIDLERPLRIEARAASWRGARIRRIASRLRALSPRELLLAPGWEPSFGYALDAFVVAAAHGRPDATGATILDGMRSLRVVLAAEEAVRTGAAVSVEAGEVG